MTWRHASIIAIFAASATLAVSTRPAWQTPAFWPDRATGASLAVLREGDLQVDRMSRASDARLRDEHGDTLISRQHHERLDQSYEGSREWGGDSAWQTDRAMSPPPTGQTPSSSAVRATSADRAALRDLDL